MEKRVLEYPYTALFFKHPEKDTLYALDIDPKNEDFIRAAIEKEKEALKKKKEVEKLLDQKNVNPEIVEIPIPRLVEDNSSASSTTNFSKYFSWWNPGPLRFTYFITPGITYRSLEDPSGTNDYVQIRNRFESPQMGLNAGMNIWFQANRHFFIRSGIEFTQFGEFSSYRFFNTLVDSMNPLDTIQLEIFNRDKNYYNYLSLPLFIGKSIDISRSVSLNIMGGLLFNRKISARANIKDPVADDLRTYTQADLVNWIISPTIKAEVTMDVGDGLRVSTGPTLIFTSRSIMNNIPSSQRPYLVGLSFSVHTNY